MMFSLKQRTLRKITNDNCVGYVPQSEKTKERNIRQNTIKTGSLPRKRNKNFHETIKNSNKISQQEDLEYLQNINCESK